MCAQEANRYRSHLSGQIAQNGQLEAQQTCQTLAYIYIGYGRGGMCRCVGVGVGKGLYLWCG